MNGARRRVMVAKFRDLKLTVLDAEQTVKCELEIEARSSTVNPEAFFLFWKVNGRPVTPYPYSLGQAKQTARALFVEQVEPWRDLEIPAP
jgi:hypothetical protein